MTLLCPNTAGDFVKVVQYVGNDSSLNLCSDFNDGFTHQWVWWGEIHSAVPRRETVILGFFFCLILRQRNRREPVVIMWRRYGDVIRGSFLFCLHIEAEENHSDGPHQAWESRSTFPSFRDLRGISSGRLHVCLYLITYKYWRIFPTGAMAGVMSTCWHCSKEKTK